MNAGGHFTPVDGNCLYAGSHFVLANCTIRNNCRCSFGEASFSELPAKDIRIFNNRRCTVTRECCNLIFREFAHRREDGL